MNFHRLHQLPFYNKFRQEGWQLFRTSEISFNILGNKQLKTTFPKVSTFTPAFSVCSCIKWRHFFCMKCCVSLLSFYQIDKKCFIEKCTTHTIHMRLHFTSEDTDIISHFSLLFLNTNSQFSYAIKRKLHSGVKIKTIFFSTAVLVISSCYCVIPSIHLRSFMPKEFVLNVNKKKDLWILKLQVDLPSVGVFVI